MLIAGFNKTSFIDYPGKISSVVFTPLCNMNCWYCHNKHILSLNGLELIDNDTVLNYLDKRHDLVQAVVITGGEPTLQKDLYPFVRLVKEKGFLVKLDSNGTRPSVMKELVRQHLIDYIAMDIKAPIAKYNEITGTQTDYDAIKESIAYLLTGAVDYEFRTTFAPTLTTEDILQIAEEIKGAKRYYLQQYRPVKTEEDGIVQLTREPHPRETLRTTCEQVKAILGVCECRGIS